MKRHTLTLLAALLLAPLAAIHAADAPQTLSNSIGMTLVRIEQGTFIMGQDGPPISGDGNMASHPAEFIIPHGEFGNSIIRTREGVLAISLDGTSLVVSRDNGQTLVANRQATR